MYKGKLVIDSYRFPVLNKSILSLFFPSRSEHYIKFCEGNQFMYSYMYA